MGTTLNDNNAMLDKLDKSIQAALERKRKLIVQGKQITYNTLAELYGKEGQELIDAVTKEHKLISRLIASGMSYDDIESLADSPAVNGWYDKSPDGDEDDEEIGQTSLFRDNSSTD